MDNKTRKQRLKERQFNAIKALGADDPLSVIKLIDELERRHNRKALMYCNDPQPDGWYERWDKQQEQDIKTLTELLPNTEPGALFINQDPRGYAVKIDNDTEQGKRAIDLSGCVTDWGGYGLLQSEAYKD